jgi:hypothetical protein
VSVTGREEPNSEKATSDNEATNQSNNPETRIPKPERWLKLEWKQSTGSRFDLAPSNFEFVSDFEFRISDFISFPLAYARRASLFGPTAERPQGPQNSLSR